ncbi:unnamed protein product [Sphagnum balticum]
MEQDDEEFEQLLCEIPHVTSTNPVVDVPRATSAPPHLEELQRVHGSEIEEGSSIGMHEDEALPAVKPFVDIRCDEHYESFYRSYAGVKKLPPPMDNRTLYSDLPRKQHQLTSLQQQPQPQQAQQQQREPSLSFQAPGAHQYEGVPSSQNDRSSSDHHLTAAFGNLSFEEGRSSAPSYEFYASRSSPSLDLFTGKPVVNMNGLRNGSSCYDGMGSDYAEIVATQAFKKAMRQQNSPGGGYGSGGAGGAAGSQYHQQLEVVAATLQAATRNPSAVASGNILPSGRLQKQIPYDYNDMDYFAAQQLVEAQAQAQATATAAQYAHLEEQQQQHRLYVQQQLMERQKQIQLLASLQAQVNGRPGGGGTYPSAGSMPIRGSRNASALQQLGFAAAANVQNNQALERKLRLQQALNPPDVVWGSNAEISELGFSDNSCRTPTVGSVCRYYLQGFCSRSEACPFLHSPLHGTKAVSHNTPVAVKEASRSTQPPKYTTLEEVEGHIYLIAKDQHGCRFLQKKFDEGGPEDVEKIFHEIISHITELMKDPFGNYLVQKLLEVCDEKQRMEILRSVTMDGELVRISLNMHGTRAVQKLIETLKSPEQIAMVITALSDGVVELIKDLNGNHVVQRCLQKLSHEDSQFIFDAAALHCVEIATHRHGCCVMQRCVDFALDHQRQRLVAEVAANALTLSQDPYGNYVVQYILDLKTAWSSTEVMARLEGNYAFLSMQKFSSNVVEKCLKLGVEEPRSRLVQELMTSPHLGQLLQDQYANYVIQSALSVCKGALHSGLVDAIRPHLPALRNSPYGKRILSRTNPKK